jgi:hypothetical protein
MPSGTFIDHEHPSRWAVTTGPDIKPAFDAYKSVRQGHIHIVPKPGDQLPIPRIQTTVVSSEAAILTKPLPGAGAQSPLCATEGIAAADPFENPRSTGVVVSLDASASWMSVT